MIGHLTGTVYTVYREMEFLDKPVKCRQIKEVSSVVSLLLSFYLFLLVDSVNDETKSKILNFRTEILGCM